jgi:hypothetical protein
VDADRSGHTWQNLQADSENIIKDGKIRKLLDEWNVGLRLSSPYKHSQNGFVERHIGMLYDLARTYMLQSNAPPSLQEDAIRYACKIMNECRIPFDMDMTPEEAFTGKRPSMWKIS